MFRAKRHSRAVMGAAVSVFCPASKRDAGVNRGTAQRRQRQFSLFLAERLEQRLFLSAVTFKPPLLYHTGINTTSVAVSDLGNGHPDLVVTWEGKIAEGGSPIGTVSVLLGNGDGTFQTQKTFATGHSPDSVAIANLGNGHPDLVVTNNADSTVSVLLGNGDGTFHTQKTYAVGSFPDSVAVADLGNGHPDLVVANNGDTTVSVLLGNGDGTFQTQKTYTAGNGPSSVAVADLGNGHSDLVVANQNDNTVSVLLGNGNGTFAAQTTFAAGSFPDAVAVTDLGNGRPDLVVANGEDDNVSVLLGNGDGTFGAQTTYATGGFPVAVALANLGDGNPDLVVANNGVGSVSVLLGNGDGTFQDQQVVTSDLPTSVAVADLGNGQPDLVVANGENDQTVSVLLQERAPLPTTTTLTSSSNPATVGATVTLTATVASASGVPTGTVSFFDGTTQLGGPVTLSAGVATLTTSSLVAGTDAITADYSGASGFPASMGSLAQSINPPQDLSAALAGSVPASVIAGTRLKLKETLTLTPGAGAGTGAGGATILLSPDDSAADSVLALASAGGAIKFKVGRAKRIKLKLPKSIPASVAAGSYHVLIRLTDTTGAVSTLDSGQTLNVLAPVVDLTGSFVKAPPTAVAGKKFKVTFLVTNSSAANVPASGLLPFDVDSSPDGLLSDATVLSFSKKRINLKPGKSIKISATATLSASASLLVNLDPGNTVFPNDITAENNIFNTLTRILVG